MMNLVEVPLKRGDYPRVLSVDLTVRIMKTGQHIMAILLTVIGVIRALADGVWAPAAIIAGIALLTWHTFGALRPPLGGTPAFARWWLVGLAGIWVAAVAVSSEFIWVSFLLWLLAGHLLPVLWGLAFSALVLAVVIAAPMMHHGTTSYANIFGPFIGGIFAYAISRGYVQLLRDTLERERLVESLTRTQVEMAELQDELAYAQRHAGMVAERTRISRDIHDTIAQSLSSIKLIAHAGASHTGGEATARTLEQIESLAAESLADARRIVAALIPAELEGDALPAALERMLERLRELTGIETVLNVDATLPLLPSEVEVALLRTAQSALANVRQHSGATQVVMSLIDAGESVRLDVVDNGTGFDVAEWEAEHLGSTQSFGLGFMRSRLRELGGGLDIESAPGQGSALSMHVPISPEPSQSSKEQS